MPATCSIVQGRVRQLRCTRRGECPSDCINGDILACVKLGTQGASATGVDIPGEDLVQAGKDAQACSDGDFAACVRLDEQAAIHALGHGLRLQP